MTRRTWTLLVSLVAVVGLAVAGGLAAVPYVALGPGPTYNTLGQAQGSQMVTISGTKTYPSEGHLNMTTVSVTDDMTLFGALGLWASGRYAVVPREEIYPPGKTDKQVRQKNTQAFLRSETQARYAALNYLKFPSKTVVGQVSEGAPAEGTLQQDDVLIEVNGRQVDSPEQVVQALADTSPGDEVSVRYRREGKGEQQKLITLGERPDADGNQGFLGIVPANRPDVPFRVKISLDRVGGPSAGLMFALAIVDRLTEGDLTDGDFVAGTGEITSEGEVGPIGGIPFKMTAARNAGASVFLVPQQNCAEAKQRAPEGLTLLQVSTLRDAVDELRALHNGGDPQTC